MGPKLDHINFVVGDMAAMADFYSRLGLHIGTPPPEWAAHHRSTDDGDVDVHLDSEPFTTFWNEGWPGGAGVVLCFGVGGREEVDRLYAEFLAAGNASQQPPYDAFWGARFAVVTDPDGNAVGLMSETDPSRRTPPPSPPFDQAATTRTV